MKEHYKTFYEELTNKPVMPNTPEWAYICEYQLNNEKRIERLYLTCKLKESLQDNWSKMFPKNLEDELEKNRQEQKNIETEIKKLKSDYLKNKLINSLIKSYQRTQKQS